jgi:hypothetical protein
MAGVTVFQPSVRLVAVSAFAYCNDNGVWYEAHQIHPVLGVRVVTALLDDWDQYDDDPTYWHDPLVLDDDGKIETAALAFSTVNMVYRVVACPWPASEDDERLADVIRELREDARRYEEDRLRRTAERKAKATTP